MIVMMVCYFDCDDCVITQMCEILYADLLNMYIAIYFMSIIPQ